MYKYIVIVYLYYVNTETQVIIIKHLNLFLVYCIIGNKSDLEDAREVSVEKAQEYASSIGASHYFTSALSNQGNYSIKCCNNNYQVASPCTVQCSKIGIC